MDISTFVNNLDFIKDIYFREEWKDKECRDTILAAIEEANKKILDAFGESMHRLHEHKPSIEAVEKVVKKFPSTLSYGNKEFNDRLPIHTAVGCFDTDYEATEYVPVLIKEGLKHQVGGEETRGGLLMEDPYDPDDNWNTLQGLCYHTNHDSDSASRLAAVKELRKMGLLVKKDIVEHDLLYKSLDNGGCDVFDYLVEWDPDALIHPRLGNQEPLLHSVVYSEDGMIKLLEAGFKYHPDKGGEFLFVEDSNGASNLDFLLSDNYEYDILGILHDILLPTKDYPILHHIFTKAPQHKEVFANKFPWAGHLRDHNGRSLHQVLLAAGPEVMNENKILFAMLTDNQIREKDPVTTLYPFAAMAVGEYADLEKCFYLLRRHPSVMDNRSRANSDTSRSRANSAVRRRKKKRKVSKT
ncbi:hypothetical protein CTEN210_00430 [Chaetoceros tenuissimus]|uniref:Uncharacterized protein n=1 Tax=Chaetoceros tenuissimus TaxID=426638 RepID=A0AAD3CFP6_9STRA|nr:hypothetical protein CTEN210_00430 [Chaetoceros tenuissimus]